MLTSACEATLPTRVVFTRNASAAVSSGVNLIASVDDSVDSSARSCLFGKSVVLTSVGGEVAVLIVGGGVVVLTVGGEVAVLTVGGEVAVLTVGGEVVVLTVNSARVWFLLAAS